MFDEEVAELRSRASEMLPDVVPPSMAERPETVGTLAGRTQTAVEMERALQRPILSGRLRSRGAALGEYHTRAEHVRTKFERDIETTAHEIGHHIHKLFFGVTPKDRLTTKPLKPWRKELFALAEELRVPKEVRGREGFAEFWRRYLTNPDAAKAKAPDFYAYAEGRLLTEFPEIHAMLKKAREDYRLWLEADPQARVRAQQVQHEAPEAWSAATPWQKFIRNIFDDQEVLGRVVRDLLGGNPKQIELDAPLYARLTRGAPSMGDAFVFHGTRDFESLQVRGKGFADIIRPLGDRLDDFRDYAVARRAHLDLHPRGVETGIRAADAKAVYERFQADEAFNTAFEEIQTYGRELLEYLRDAGVISEESVQRILALNPNWVPFYRLQYPARRGARGGIRTTGGQFGHLFDPVKRIRGSTAEIIDPLEGIIKNTYLYTHLAARQQLSLALARLANVHGAGRWIREIPAPVRPTKVSVREMVDLFSRKLQERRADVFSAGVEPEMADAVGQALSELVESAPGLADELLMVWRPGDYFGKDNVISVLIGGKRHWYEVEPDLYAALMGLDRETSSGLVRFLSFPARLLRAGATTFSPEFMLRNPARDAVQAFIWSEYGFKPGIDNVRGLFHLAKRDDLYWNWKAAGGEWAALVDMDRRHLRAEIRGAKVENVLKSPLDALAALSALMENSTRMGEFARGVAREGTTKAGLQRAAGAAREAGVDFARHGAKTASVRLMSAFWNARLQGYKRMVRAFREHPARTTARAFVGITMPSVLLYYANRDDPEYWEIPQWERDLFWCVKINGTWFRIPKPFELGLVFGTILGERLPEWLDTQDPVSVRRMAEETLSREISTTFLPIPTAFGPPFESFINYNFFLKRKIVPERLKEVGEARYQYREYTTDVARGLGDMLNVSPAKIDNVLLGWTGGFGRMAAEAAGTAGRAVGVFPERRRPAPRMRDWPVIRGFTVRYPPSSSESESRFWDEYSAMAGVKGTLDHLKREQDPDLEAYQQAHADDLARYGELEQTADLLRQLIAQQRFINRATHMTDEEQRDAIENLQRSRIMIARQAIGRETPGGPPGDLEELSRQFAERFNKLMRGAALQKR
ncbi:MAG: hypothetical protein GTO22_05455 [Gemmatimonadales bacterium]|nr:hypothetical protein [Gemmatimonadales bacterium]